MANHHRIPWTDTRRDYHHGTCANPRCRAAFIALTTWQRYCTPACEHRASSNRYYRRRKECTT